MAKIDKELVFELASELRAMGEPVTNLAIRKMNGENGSLTTIAPLLKEWKESLIEEKSEAESMPEELIINTIKPLWSVLKKQSRIDLAEKTALFEAKEHDLLAEVEQFSAEFDRQERLIAETNHKLKEAETELTELAGNLQKITNKSEVQKREIVVIEGESKSLKNSINTATEQLSRAQTDSELLKQQINQLQLQISNQSNELSSTNADKAKALTDIAVLEEKNKQLETRLGEQVRANKELGDTSYVKIKELDALVITLQLTNNALTESTANLEEDLEKNIQKVKEQQAKLQSKEIEVSKLVNKAALDKDHYLTKLDEIANLNMRNGILELANSKLQDSFLKLNG